MSEYAQGYYAHANPYFLAAVRDFGAPSRVLDVGCWNGTLGRALMRSTDVTVDGIERDPRQAQAARDAGYRRVDVVDLNWRLPELPDRYDFIFFGDVLEHLVDPHRVLVAFLAGLKPGGRVIVSLPNIAFVVNRVTHLLGRWDYKDYGILDRTHLRFFTRRTMRSLLHSAGLHVLATYGYVGLATYPLAIRIPARVLARLWPDLFAIQIVLEAEIQRDAPP